MHFEVEYPASVKSWSAARTYIDLINEAVRSTGYLVGTHFTYADMTLLPVLAYLRQCPESGAAMNSGDALRQYFECHSDWASYKATVSPPFAEWAAPR